MNEEEDLARFTQFVIASAKLAGEPPPDPADLAYSERYARGQVTREEFRAYALGRLDQLRREHDGGQADSQ